MKTIPRPCACLITLICVLSLVGGCPEDTTKIDQDSQQSPINSTDDNSDGSADDTPTADAGSASDGAGDGTSATDAGTSNDNGDGAEMTDAGASDGNMDATIVIDAGLTNGSGNNLVTDGGATDGGNNENQSTNIADCGDAGVAEAEAQSPELLADGQDYPIGLASYGDYLYWVNESGGEVMRALKSSGAAEVLITGQASPISIAVDASGIYWMNSGFSQSAAQKMGHGETTATTLNENTIAGPRSIALNATHVFWSAPFESTIHRLVKTGGTAETLHGGQDYPHDIEVTDSNVFWLDQKGIYTASVASGSTRQTLANDQTFPFRIEVDEVAAYWLTQSGKTLKKVDLNSGEVTLLASLESAGAGLAMDANHLFWAAGGQIKKINKDGCGETLLVAGMDYTPTEMATDDNHLYWTASSAGQVYRVTK